MNFISGLCILIIYLYIYIYYKVIYIIYIFIKSLVTQLTFGVFNRDF